MLTRKGFLKLRARPITVHIECDIAEHFWYGGEKSVSPDNILIHTILVIGLNLGVR